MVTHRFLAFSPQPSAFLKRANVREGNHRHWYGRLEEAVAEEVVFPDHFDQFVVWQHEGEEFGAEVELEPAVEQTERVRLKIGLIVANDAPLPLLQELQDWTVVASCRARSHDARGHSRFAGRRLHLGLGL